MWGGEGQTRKTKKEENKGEPAKKRKNAGTGVGAKNKNNGGERAVHRGNRDLKDVGHRKGGKNENPSMTGPETRKKERKTQPEAKSSCEARSGGPPRTRKRYQQNET